MTLLLGFSIPSPLRIADLSPSSQGLLPYVTSAQGLDLSPGMVSSYNDWASSAANQPGKAQAQVCDLLPATEEQLADPSLQNFDIATISMALHHVADPALLLARLARCLRPGGVCVVLDMVPQGHHEQEVDEVMREEGEKVRATIAKHGFSEGEMRTLLAGAGLGVEVEYVLVEKPFEFTMRGRKGTVQGFFAKGRRPL